ncbi:MAG: hypothetical protein H0V01_04460 [Bacteroidetes bacterium]|nr:hypothetical protein [Bacteroidota bacterium]HET6243904.1 hypothetical protein [Bacteroidia bacterium]
MIKNKTLRKSIALFMLINFINQLFCPTLSFALNGGPNAPEFSSFEPVATTDMVNPFSGDFTYNLPVIKIPGPDGGGYPLSLSYHSGASSEEEASWVGFGWTLNAGSVNRSLRGFPDDYKNDTVTQYNKVRPNWSSAITVDGEIEKKSKDKQKKDSPKDSVSTVGLSLGLDHSLRYNNYQGFSPSTGFDVNIAGYGSVGANVSGGGITFSANVDVLNILNSSKKKNNSNNTSQETVDSETKKESFVNRSYKSSKAKTVGDFKNVGKAARDLAINKVSVYGTHSISNFSSNVSVARYKGVSYDWALNSKVDIGRSNYGIEFGHSGNYNIQANDPEFIGLACGFMYNPNIDNLLVSGGDKILSDHFVEKGNPYNKRDHFLGMPFSNSDSYFISGEGLGGGFQLFHKKLGHYYPNFLTSEQKLKKLALEFTVGFSVGKIVDLGIGFNFNVPGTGKHKVEISDWRAAGNPVCKKTPADFQFDPSDKGFFRFNNDLGGSVEYSINGNSDAVTAEVSEPGISSLVLPSSPSPQDFITAAFTLLGITEIPTIDFYGFGPGDTLNFPCVNIPQIIPATKHFYAELGNMGLRNIDSEDYSVGGSSFIDYNIFPITDENKRFEKDPGLKIISKNYDQAMKDGIAELSIHNESGLRYVYGLPVYARNERNFQIGTEKEGTVENNYLYYSPAANPVNLKFPLKNKTITGEAKNKPYATAYLLTQITTPDYVNVVNPNDATTNGLGPEDFGGWTKFGYRNAAFTNNLLASEWYQYRTPYSGLLYQKNSLSDSHDDIATVSTGEKQVYYMKAIETKTHVAFFITNQTLGTEFNNYLPLNMDPALKATIINSLNGSLDDRLDGLGALRFDSQGMDPASIKGNSANMNNDQKVEKLERIVLYAKSRFEKPIQTTHFEYNNSLVRNLPNSQEGNYPINPNSTKDYNKSGKLTLKKIWFEYEGVVQAKISPYVFKYIYRTDYTSGAASGNKYQHLNEMARYSISDQNPDYQPESLDIWGNYQYQGAGRKALLKPWVSQENRALIQDKFDPAAWQLKQIQLPSGGEINIQYEEGDYCFVQDRAAMAMISLLPGSVDSNKPNETKYLLNLADVGLNTLSSAEKVLLVNKLSVYFGLLPEKNKDEREKVFFKFLYALKGNNPSLNSCKSDYITGYTEVNTIGIDSGGNIFFSLGTKNGGKKNVPKWVAHSFLATQRNGLLNNNDCFGELENVDQQILEQYHVAVQNGDDFEDSFDSDFRKDFVRPVLKKLAKKQFSYPTPKVDDVGTVNYPLSYLRIPLLTTNKKGGGIRVKRVLMFDNGVNTGDVTVYGTEYTYTLEDGRSSGVATNEPGSEENALKTFLPRLKQSFASKVISGLDRKQSEGPLGESLLPSPLVSYSRITVRNIHTGKTGTGFKVEEYYTAKDFAFDRLYDEERSEIEGRGVEHTELKDNRKKDKINIPLGLFNYSVQKLWLAQGFRFINTNMHGQLRKMSNYGNSGQLSSYSEYEYYLPGERVPMLIYNKDTETYSINYTNPGKEEQITSYMNSFSDINMNLSLNLDLVVSILTTGATATFGLFPSFTYAENEFNTHTTTKVLRYPAIQKSVTNYQDGVVNHSENLAFNPHSGKPVLTKTTDGFDRLRLEQQNANLIQNGSYYNLVIPASWIYDEMGQKSKISNSDSRTNQLTEVAGNITYYGKSPFLNISNLSSIPPNLHGVVSATAQSYKKDWFEITGNETIDNEYGITNNMKLELNKKWHSRSSYVFRTNVTSSNGLNDRIYTGGLFNNFTMFKWDSLPTNSSNPWLISSETTKYSPHGLPLEERNILDIYSSNKYGYGGVLVTVAAQNASYNSVQFEDFENCSIPNVIIDTIAHSGNKSLVYSALPGHLFINPVQKVILNQQLKTKGASVKIWVQSAFYSPSSVNSNNNLKVEINNVLEKPFTKIAQTGEWTLYEAKLSQNDFNSIPVNSILSLKLNYTIQNSEIVYMDDFRFQPLNAQAVCYVYDVASLKLLTQFDDQHFGLYYQYNDEGKLVRNQIETERGLKTIQEKQYHTPLIPRNLP